MAHQPPPSVLSILAHAGLLLFAVIGWAISLLVAAFLAFLGALAVLLISALTVANSVIEGGRSRPRL